MNMKSNHLKLILSLIIISNIKTIYACMKQERLRSSAPTARALSTAERDRVSAQIAMGDMAEGWRFVVRSLFSSDLEIHSNGTIVLLRLVGKQESYGAPARALLEQGLVRSRRMDYREEATLIWMYDLFAEPQKYSIDQVAYAESSKLAEAAHRVGRLSTGAMSYCNKLLATSDQSKWRASIMILLVASQLRKEDKRWTHDVCHKLLGRVHEDKSAMWTVLYETVSSSFLPKLK